MLSARHQKVKALIQSSSVLTSGERQEWLEMLELMNDKQLSDLENILAPAPMPHIANLPKGVKLVGSQVQSTPVQQHSPSTKWLDDMKLIMTEKELPAGHISAKPEPAPAPVMHIPEIEIEAEDDDPRVPSTWEPKTAADCALLSLAIYRNLGAKKIISLLQPLVRTQGYAYVLHNLQQSKLYKTYIATGHNFLASGTGDTKSVMSKKEFEEVVDMLRQIQVN